MANTGLISQMKNNYWILLIACITFSQWVIADEEETTFTLEPSARYRYQDVADTNLGDAQANTLKLRLNANWQPNEKWQSFAQFDYVHAFNENHYNSVTVNRNTSPIPDPPGDELNQLWGKFQSDTNWSVTVGRQSVGLDNERHVGKIEFWQNDQTFDAVRFQYQDNLKWTINYLYLNKVKRIFGEDARATLSPEDSRFATNTQRPLNELGVHQHNSHLLNINYTFTRELRLSLYSYLLDNRSAKMLSSDTYGIRLLGDIKPQKIKYSYTLEFARQFSSNANPGRYSANYMFLEGSAQLNSHKFSVVYEKLGANNGFGFTTSLGTNHKFQGWADVFANYSSGGGLIDAQVSYQGRDGKLRWNLVGHQFNDVPQNIKIGNEVDFKLAYRYNRDWEFEFIAAKYLAAEGLVWLPASQHDLTTWMLSAAYKL
jgi:hypothetical protein